MIPDWRDALMKLHVRGWDTDDIDLAAEALQEACTEGAYEGTPIYELSPERVGEVLRQQLPAEEALALVVVAELRAGEGGEADALRQALYDLDAFAYEYAGDD